MYSLLIIGVLVKCRHLHESFIRQERKVRLLHLHLIETLSSIATQMNSHSRNYSNSKDAYQEIHAQAWWIPASLDSQNKWPGRMSLIIYTAKQNELSGLVLKWLKILWEAACRYLMNHMLQWVKERFLKAYSGEADSMYSLGSTA